MRYQDPCAEWKEMLAISCPEKDLSPAEYEALEAHVAQCPHCAITREQYALISARLHRLACHKKFLPDDVSIPSFVQTNRTLHEEHGKVSPSSGTQLQRYERESKYGDSFPKEATFVNGTVALEVFAANSFPLEDSFLLKTIEISSSYLRAKRILDITFTLLLSPLLIIVGIIIALCIRLDSKGPVFFRQKRYGENGTEFEFLKFRSMYVNNDEAIHRQKILEYMKGQALNEDTKGTTTYKYMADPRITRVGHFIRKTCLDELPQFWNVLRGEMSLVGPRPSISYEADQYGPYERLRLLGKPGLTGTWQVYGRSRVTFQEMIEMDIKYLEQQSIWQDIKLILLTVPMIIFGNYHIR